MHEVPEDASSLCTSFAVHDHASHAQGSLAARIMRESLPHANILPRSGRGESRKGEKSRTSASSSFVCVFLSLRVSFWTDLQWLNDAAVKN